MAFWLLTIIAITASMVAFYYALPNSPEVILLHAYGILLVALGGLYRVVVKYRRGEREQLQSTVDNLDNKLSALERKDTINVE